MIRKLDQIAGVAAAYVLTGGAVISLESASLDFILQEAEDERHRTAVVETNFISFGLYKADEAARIRADPIRQNDRLTQFGYAVGIGGVRVGQAVLIPKALGGLGRLAGTGVTALFGGTRIIGPVIEAFASTAPVTTFAARLSGIVGGPAIAYYDGKAAYYSYLNGDLVEAVDRGTQAGLGGLLLGAAGREFLAGPGRRGGVFLLPPNHAFRRGTPQKIEMMSAEEMVKWERYLGRRGVKVEHSSDDIFAAIGVKWEAFYAGKTLFLRGNPSKSAFLEEAFHAIQDLRGLPRTMLYNGISIDRWEFEAQRALIRYRHRLGIPNVQTQQTLKNLRRVYNGTYNN